MAGFFDDVPVRRNGAFDDVPTTPEEGSPAAAEARAFAGQSAVVTSDGRILGGSSATPSLGALIVGEVTKPFVELPRPEVEADDTKLTQFGKGLSQAGIGVVEGLESPLGVSVLAASALPVVGKAVGRIAAAGFGAKSVLEGFKEAASAWQLGDMEQAGRAVGNLLLGSAMVRGSVAGSLVKGQESVVRSQATTEVSMLPEFLPHAESKTTFSQPFGAGRVPLLGRIVDPNARMSTGPLPESLAAYNAEKYGVAPAAGSNVGLQLKARGIDEAFPVDPKTGEFTTVQPTRPGQSLHPRDVMVELQADPNAYLLTSEQRAAFLELERWRGELDAFETQHQIKPADIAAIAEEGDTGYFPRIVIKRPETDVAPLAGGNRVGSKQFFQKTPIFESEMQGVAKGYMYEPSLVARAVTRTERAYRVAADKRLANDPTLGARSRAEVEAEMREGYAEELGAGTISETTLQQMVNSVEHKGTVWGHPGFAGKIFDAETANTLNRAFPQADSAFRSGFIKVNNALKAMRLSADVGAPFIQGLVTLFRNPSIWGKAVGSAYRSLWDDAVLARYAQANSAPVLELAKYGSSVGRLPEMLAGLEKGNFAERLPVAGPVFRAAGRHFETFLDVAKVELWKSWREVTPENQTLPVIRAIESQLALGRMESIGVSRNRSLAERAMLLAPSYYRGAVNLIGAIGERGVAGQVARRSLAAYAAGGVLTYLGIANALEMDEDTINERLNPAHPQFLMWDVEVNGRRLNVGFGGIHRSLLRLMANITTTSLEHPENWKSLTPAKNPIVRWYRGHAAAVPGLTWDAITGKDYLGQESDLTTVGQSVVPLAVQPLVRGHEDTKTAETAASLIGISAYPAR